MNPPAPTGIDGVLERFLADVVTDDYVAAPDSPSTPGRRIAGHAVSAAVLGLIGILVVVAVMSTREADALRQGTRAALVDRVTALSATVDQQQAQVDGQTMAVDDLRAQVLGAEDAGALTDATEALVDAAGAAPVTGPGVVVTVDDAPESGEDSLNRVLDRDVQDIVNALWRGGAVAIAVNDQRLTSTTAVRGAGEAILVNFQPLTRPYRVSAVGPTASTLDLAGTQSLLNVLSTDYGLVTDIAPGDVALPAGPVRPMRYATPTEGVSAP